MKINYIFIRYLNYLELRGSGMLREYLSYYPEYTEEYNGYRDNLHKLSIDELNFLMRSEEDFLSKFINFLRTKDKPTFPMILHAFEEQKTFLINLTEDKNQVFGRSEYMTPVIFDGKKENIGKILSVKIVKSNRSTLFGELINNSNKKVA